MLHRISEKMLTKRALRRSILTFLINALINVFALPACAQTAANGGWPLLEDGLGQKSALFQSVESKTIVDLPLKSDRATTNKGKSHSLKRSRGMFSFFIFE